MVGLGVVSEQMWLLLFRLGVRSVGVVGGGSDAARSDWAGSGEMDAWLCVCQAALFACLLGLALAAGSTHNGTLLLPVLKKKAVSVSSPPSHQTSRCLPSPKQTTPPSRCRNEKI